MDIAGRSVRSWCGGGGGGAACRRATGGPAAAAAERRSPPNEMGRGEADWRRREGKERKGPAIKHQNQIASRWRGRAALRAGRAGGGRGQQGQQALLHYWRCPPWIASRMATDSCSFSTGLLRHGQERGGAYGGSVKGASLRHTRRTRTQRRRPHRPHMPARTQPCVHSIAMHAAQLCVTPEEAIHACRDALDTVALAGVGGHGDNGHRAAQLADLLRGLHAAQHLRRGDGTGKNRRLVGCHASVSCGGGCVAAQGGTARDERSQPPVQPPVQPHYRTPTGTHRHAHVHENDIKLGVGACGLLHSL